MADNGVAAVDRALGILEAFGPDDTTLSLAELARRTGLYKSTLLRLAASLERAGYLRRSTDGQFRLGPTVLKLGGLYQRSFDLGDYVNPVLRQLAERSGESTSFYVREGDRRICLYRVNSMQHRILHYVQVGSQLALHTGASGQVILAFTETSPEYAEIRQTGLAISLQRSSETAAMACPVFGPAGFVGAISMAGPRHRFGPAQLPELQRAVLEAALELTVALGGQGQLLRITLAQLDQ